MAPSELPKTSNRFRRRLEYQGSLRFRGREGEGPGAPGKEADGRRKEDEARGEVGSVGAKIGAKIGCQCIELENVNNGVLSTIGDAHRGVFAALTSSGGSARSYLLSGTPYTENSPSKGWPQEREAPCR